MQAMKKIVLILIAAWACLSVLAQEKGIPDVKLRDVDGNLVSAAQIAIPGTSTLIIFWKSSSNKCCDNLDMLQDAWDETLNKAGVRLVAICVDCNGGWSHVKPIVDGNSWDFDTYIDVNGDFKRAMSVADVPCTMLFDQDQNLVCRYNSVCAGSQEFLCKNIIDHLSLTVTSPNYEAVK
jgi:hypothetical protein